MPEVSPGAITSTSGASCRSKLKLTTLLVCTAFLIGYVVLNNRDGGSAAGRAVTVSGARNPLGIGANSIIKEVQDNLSQRFFTREQKLPGCIIIGARKCGTRALLRFLDLHPAVRAYRGRELHYFDNETRYANGINWYLDKMPLARPDQLVLEKTPAYFHTAKVPPRIREMNPKIKLLVVVRNPVERAVSDYAQLTEKNALRGRPMETFRRVVFFRNGSVNHSSHYVAIGRYADHYRNWLRYFPENQVHIVDGEVLIDNPLQELAKVEKFLGLESRISTAQLSFDHEKGFFCPVEKNKRRCLGRTKGRVHPYVAKSLLNRLSLYFLPFNREFCRLTGLQFPWC